MKRFFFAGIVLLVLSLLFIFRGVLLGPPSSATPTPSDTGVSFDGIPDQRLIDSPVPYSQLTGPGSCALSNGKIEFLDMATAQHNNAYLSYKNIDNPARLVTWHVSPDDGSLRVGPNIMANLGLPNGQTTLTVSFNNDFLTIKFNGLGLD